MSEQTTIMNLAKSLKASSEQRELPEFLGSLFPRKQITVIASKPGIGKTWFTLLNIRKITGEGLKCVLFNGETGFDIIQDRITLLGWTIPENLCLCFNSNEALKLGGITVDDQEGWKNFVTICNTFKPDAIFIDSLLAFMGSDESEMKAMRDIFTRLKNLAETLNLAVVINHHLRKSSGQEFISIDDFIGSSAISRIACCLFSLTNNGTDVITVECLKSWYQKPKTFNFKLSNFGNSMYITNGLGADMAHKKIDDVRTFLQHNDWVTVAEVAAKLQMHPQSTYRCLEQLIFQAEAERRQKDPSSKLLEYHSKTPI